MIEEDNISDNYDWSNLTNEINDEVDQHSIVNVNEIKFSIPSSDIDANILYINFLIETPLQLINLRKTYNELLEFYKANQTLLKNTFFPSKSNSTDDLKNEKIRLLLLNFFTLHLHLKVVQKYFGLQNQEEIQAKFSTCFKNEALGSQANWEQIEKQFADFQKPYCARPIISGSLSFKCFDCEIRNDNQIICADCFMQGNHEDHLFIYITTLGGGYCDCGDMKALKPQSICKEHSSNHDISTIIQQVNPATLEAIEKVTYKHIHKIFTEFDKKQILVAQKHLITLIDFLEQQIASSQAFLMIFSTIFLKPTYLLLSHDCANLNWHEEEMDNHSSQTAIQEEQNSVISLKQMKQMCYCNILTNMLRYCILIKDDEVQNRVTNFLITLSPNNKFKDQLVILFGNTYSNFIRLQANQQMMISGFNLLYLLVFSKEQGNIFFQQSQFVQQQISLWLRLGHDIVGKGVNSFEGIDKVYEQMPYMIRNSQGEFQKVVLAKDVISELILRLFCLGLSYKGNTGKPSYLLIWERCNLKYFLFYFKSIKMVSSSVQQKALLDTYIQHLIKMTTIQSQNIHDRPQDITYTGVTRLCSLLAGYGVLFLDYNILDKCPEVFVETLFKCTANGLALFTKFEDPTIRFQLYSETDSLNQLKKQLIKEYYFLSCRLLYDLDMALLQVICTYQMITAQTIVDWLFTLLGLKGGIEKLQESLKNDREITRIHYIFELLCALILEETPMINLFVWFQDTDENWQKKMLQGVVSSGGVGGDLNGSNVAWVLQSLHTVIATCFANRQSFTFAQLQQLLTYTLNEDLKLQYFLPQITYLDKSSLHLQNEYKSLLNTMVFYRHEAIRVDLENDLTGKKECVIGQIPTQRCSNSIYTRIIDNFLKNPFLIIFCVNTLYFIQENSTQADIYLEIICFCLKIVYQLLVRLEFLLTSHYQYKLDPFPENERKRLSSILEKLGSIQHYKSIQPSLKKLADKINQIQKIKNISSELQLHQSQNTQQLPDDNKKLEELQAIAKKEKMKQKQLQALQELKMRQQLFSKANKDQMQGEEKKILEGSQADSLLQPACLKCHLPQEQNNLLCFCCHVNFDNLQHFYFQQNNENQETDVNCEQSESSEDLQMEAEVGDTHKKQKYRCQQSYSFFINSCIHAFHYECFANIVCINQNMSVKESRGKEKNEFQCPCCDALSNLIVPNILPIIISLYPLLNLNQEQKHLQIHEYIAMYLQEQQDQTNNPDLMEEVNPYIILFSDQLSQLQKQNYEFYQFVGIVRKIQQHDNEPILVKILQNLFQEVFVFGPRNMLENRLDFTRNLIMHGLLFEKKIGSMKILVEETVTFFLSFNLMDQAIDIKASSPSVLHNYLINFLKAVSIILFICPLKYLLTLQEPIHHLMKQFALNIIQIYSRILLVDILNDFRIKLFAAISPYLRLLSVIKCCIQFQEFIVKGQEQSYLTNIFLKALDEPLKELEAYQKYLDLDLESLLQEEEIFQSKQNKFMYQSESMVEEKKEPQMSMQLALKNPCKLYTLSLPETYDQLIKKYVKKACSYCQSYPRIKNVHLYVCLICYQVLCNNDCMNQEVDKKSSHYLFHNLIQHALRHHCNQTVYLNLYDACTYLYAFYQLQVFGVIYTNKVGLGFKMKLFSDEIFDWNEYYLDQPLVHKLEQLLMRRNVTREIGYNIYNEQKNIQTLNFHQQ